MKKLYEEIESLSFDEFEALVHFIDKARNERAKAILDEAHKQASRLIKDEIISSKKSSKSKSAKPAKYRDPKDPENTWSGYGRQPDWMKEHIAGGGNKDDLLIA